MDLCISEKNPFISVFKFTRKNLKWLKDWDRTADDGR